MAPPSRSRIPRRSLSLQQLRLPRRDLCRMHVMQLRQLSARIFLPLIAAKATLAVNVGL